MRKGRVSDEWDAGNWWNTGPRRTEFKLSLDRILLIG